jgi:hypothetical protein
VEEDEGLALSEDEGWADDNRGLRSIRSYAIFALGPDNLLSHSQLAHVPEKIKLTCFPVVGR